MFATAIRTLVVLLALTSPILAQDYPRQTIRMVVPFSAGGGTDVLARIVAAALSERMGVQVIVENRVGSGSLVGSDSVAKAAPDGYTILYTSVSHAINPTLYKRMPYGADDLVPIALVGKAPLVLALHPSVPAKDLRELIALMKANPGKYNFASSGLGAVVHMAGELFKSMAGVDIVHVPYRGAGPALTDLLAGRVALMFDQVSSVASHIDSGALRGIGVTYKERSKLLPNVPTIEEGGLPGYEAYTWNLVLAPRGTPAPIIERLNRELSAVLRSPQLRGRYTELGADAPDAMSPGETARFLASETTKWGEIVRSTGASIE